MYGTKVLVATPRSSSWGLSRTRLAQTPARTTAHSNASLPHSIPTRLGGLKQTPWAPKPRRLTQWHSHHSLLSLADLPALVEEGEGELGQGRAVGGEVVDGGVAEVVGEVGKGALASYVVLRYEAEEGHHREAPVLNLLQLRRLEAVTLAHAHRVECAACTLPASDHIALVPEPNISQTQGQMQAASYCARRERSGQDT